MAPRCKSRKAMLYLRCVRPDGHRGKHRASEKEIRNKLRQLVEMLTEEEEDDDERRELESSAGQLSE
jgi:hypothetical protein